MIQVKTNPAEAYNAIVNLIKDKDYGKAETVAAILTLVGDIYYGSPMPNEKIQPFIKDISEWLTLYFMEQDPDFKGGSSRDNKLCLHSRQR